MNGNQQKAIVVAVLISILMLVFIPTRWLGLVDGVLSHEFVLSVTEGFLFSGMDLVIQLGIVWGVTALLIAALKSPN